MRRLTVIVYFAVVLIPVVLLGHDGPWLGAGDFDIRGKAPFPKKFTPGTFRDFDEWFADHLGLRYPLIYAGTGLHIGLLRRPLDRHIFFGRDGWMFWTDDAETIPATMADSRSRLAILAGRGRAHRRESPRRPGPVRPMRDAGFRQSSCRTSRASTESTSSAAKSRSRSTRFDALMQGLSEPARSIMLDSRPAMRAAAAAQRSDPALSEDRDALERAWRLLRLPRHHDSAGAHRFRSTIRRRCRSNDTT